MVSQQRQKVNCMLTKPLEYSIFKLFITGNRPACPPLAEISREGKSEHPQFFFRYLLRKG